MIRQHAIKNDARLESRFIFNAKNCCESTERVTCKSDSREIQVGLERTVRFRIRRSNSFNTNFRSSSRTETANSKAWASLRARFVRWLPKTDFSRSAVGKLDCGGFVSVVDRGNDVATTGQIFKKERCNQ